MPNWGYSARSDLGVGVKASGRDLRISPKAAREICRSIRHARLDEARRFLQDVIDMKRAVPYRRHKKEVPHKAGLDKWYAGRYPVKAARAILKVLDSLEANCEDQGFDVERVRLVHVAAQRARVLKRFVPRAFGRSSPNYEHLTHIELLAEEV
ncbi:MAG: 50S ribosomal protein L22 [Candidatus Bathyarchaeota archaeon]|jgi:large subunit ribosomal protein L22|nr:50S ribosomal protein L22 [Candidatus Bathyarchaeota archaeon]